MTIGIPETTVCEGWKRLCAMIAFDDREEECFYGVPEEFASLADFESSNCFLSGLLYPAMRLGENIRVEGVVSAKLLYDLNEYAIPFLSMCDTRLKKIKIEASRTDPDGHPCAKGSATGFSGGIDSFFTICRHSAATEPDGFKLTHLCFFNVGAHGVGKTDEDLARAKVQFAARYEKLKTFADEEGFPFVPVDSNVHKFHPWGHLETATFATVSAGLFLGRGLRRYFIASSGHTYRQLWKFLGDGGRPDAIERVNMAILPWLSTETLDFIDDGNMFDRSDKTALVAEYPPAARHLNVCSGHDTLDTNCSVCPKCSRTLLTLEILGKLDAFSGVFDIGKYRRQTRRQLIAETIVRRKTNLFARHLCDLAAARGFDLRRQVRAIDIFRARLTDGRLHSFIKNNPSLKRLARKFFKNKDIPEK